MLKQLFYSLFAVTILFSGCSTWTVNVEKPAIEKDKNTTQVTSEDEMLDEFDDEFGEDAIEEKPDPLKGYNEIMTEFNDGFYIHVFDPVARGYNYIVPKDARKSVKKFFHNLMYPIRLVNNVLQGKFANAGEETGRFIVNSTVGVLGFFDPASEHLNWEPHNEDFGQTLGYWGVSGGYHIVLPILGPSNVRDMLSMYPDSLANPIHYHSERSYNLAQNGNDALLLSSYQQLNNGSLTLEEYNDLKKDAVKLYPFLKDIYEQRRKKLIEE